MLIRALRALALIGVAGLAAALLFSFLAPILPLADSVGHFRLHLIALLGLGAVVLALLGRRRAGMSALLLAGPAALFGLAPAFPDWGGAAEAAGERPEVISIAQFNLNYANRAPDQVVDWIRAHRPEVVTLQEVSRRNETILAQLRADYPHQTSCPFAAAGRVAVLSRLPPAPGRSRFCANGLGYVWLRVMKAGRAVSVGSLHLFWPYPHPQGAQLDRLEAAFAETPRPVLLGGDFNAAPWSHAADRVARGIGAPLLGGLRFTIDAPLAVVLRLPLLEAAPPLAMAIDHIAADPAFAPIAAATGPKLGSDHRPVLARLRLRPAR